MNLHSLSNKIFYGSLWVLLLFFTGWFIESITVEWNLARWWLILFFGVVYASAKMKINRDMSR